jgi:V8-like Glu-specific endopeptidase
VSLPDRPKDVHRATTVFTPDDRYIFNDTAFPWCTTGRVDTPGGQASGVMVGPRHMLTCSHAIQWNADGTAGWVKFTPSYFDGSAPFGVAWGTMIYWEELKVFGPTVDRTEGQHDYVAVVLNTRIGDLTGWMGSRSWSDDWDGGSYWSHIGYPGDLAGGQRPSYQASIALDGSFWDREVHTRIFHQGDVWPGQSGGPFFGWWDGEPWPRVVADQSGQASDENSASGGAHMIDCIIRALNDFP